MQSVRGSLLRLRAGGTGSGDLPRGGSGGSGRCGGLPELRRSPLRRARGRMVVVLSALCCLILTPAALHRPTRQGHGGSRGGIGCGACTQLRLRLPRCNASPSERGQVWAAGTGISCRDRGCDRPCVVAPVHLHAPPLAAQQLASLLLPPPSQPLVGHLPSPPTAAWSACPLTV